MAADTRRASLGIERLMAAVAEQAQIPAVPAYLDLAQPDLKAAAYQLADAGHTRPLWCPCSSRRLITPPSMCRRPYAMSPSHCRSS